MESFRYLIISWTTANYARFPSLFSPSKILEAKIVTFTQYTQDGRYQAKHHRRTDSLFDWNVTNCQNIPIRVSCFFLSWKKMYKSVIGFTRGCEVEIKLLSDATLLQSTVYNINLSELISRVARFCKIVASEPELRRGRGSSEAFFFGERKWGYYLLFNRFQLAIIHPVNRVRYPLWSFSLSIRVDDVERNGRMDLEKISIEKKSNLNFFKTFMLSNSLYSFLSFFSNSYQR